MTNEIMKLADSYMRFCAFLQDGKGVAAASKAREALEQAVQAQAAEIERLNKSIKSLDGESARITRDVTRVKGVAVSAMKERDTLQAKLDAATKVPLTDEQIEDLAKVIAKPIFLASPLELIRQGIRGAEAAHNIKGTTP